MNSRNQRLVTAAALTVFTFIFSFTASAAPIDKVEEQVRALAATVDVLRAVTALQQKSIEELRRNNDLLAKKLKCVASSSGDVDFVFEGCNVHVRNGVGQTSTTNGRGNLIIGYNKNEVSTRTGSHNLVVGDLHEYTSYGGIVSGTENTLSAPNATILSSVDSQARLGSSSTILSADRGITDAAAVIVGGHRDYVGTTGNFGAVIGGTENTISGGAAVSVGGTLNNSSGSNTLVCGGSENSAVGNEATVCGGSSNAGNGLDSSISGGSHNSANGRASSVSGGWTNTADGDYSSILGGNSITVGATYGTSP